MSADMRIPVTGYCPTQGKEFTAFGNYVSDGDGHFLLGTIFCPYLEQANKCKENTCPLREKMKKTI